MAPSPDLDSLRTTYRQRVNLNDWRGVLSGLGIYPRGDEREDMAYGWIEFTIEEHGLNVPIDNITIAVVDDETFHHAADPEWLGVCYSLPTYYDGIVTTEHFTIAVPDKVWHEFSLRQVFGIIKHELAHAEECYNHGCTMDGTERFEAYLDMLGAPISGDDL